MILRWIIILLIAALPLRSGMAAAQICPWMAAGLSAQMASPSTAATTVDNFNEGCAGMSTVDGSCTLQAGCGATPLLPGDIQIVVVKIMPVHTSWQAAHLLYTYSPVPQHVPIFTF